MSHLSGLIGNTCLIEPYLDPYTGVLQPGGLSKSDTVASSINSSGQVAGYSCSAADGICNDGTDHGLFTPAPPARIRTWVFHRGKHSFPFFSTHAQIPSAESEATAINDAGTGRRLGIRLVLPRHQRR